MKTFNVNAVSTAIGVPIADWGGNCHRISSLMVDKQLVPNGRVTRGLWIGDITLGNRFSGRPFTGHSWIETPDGTIVDPTRWVFLNEPPRVYVGPNDGNYDRGGNKTRQADAPPYPDYDSGDRPQTLIVSEDALTRIGELVNNWAKFNTCANNIGRFSWKQFHWISHLDPDDLGEYAEEIYLGLADLHWKASIPLDNWNFVIGAK